MKKIVVLSLFLSFAALASAEPGFSETPPNSNSLTTRYNHSVDPDIVAERQSSSAPEQIPLEIERKFLIDPNKIPQDLLRKAERFEIVQTYISSNPEVRVRRVDQDGLRWYLFTMKLPKDAIGLSRTEMEFELSQTVYQDLVKKRVGLAIQKTRLQFLHDSYTFCVDIYRDPALAGLSVVEVEFDNQQQAAAFVPPKWFGQDVTADRRYKNANLARDGKPAEK